MAVGHPFAYGERLKCVFWIDAPRTDRCSIAVVVRILFIFLSGKNPETKANAAAFPQSFRPLRCFQRELAKVIICAYTQRTYASPNREASGHAKSDPLNL
ncbi:hypothetical protein PaeBR_06945 [Paenibacillus sp. BR2-3]|uniref:hypothetical protein n=1 Tax=Paenibacillus sp. BR2-3 TaxID=3048494 RepID=UPI0039778860